MWTGGLGVFYEYARLAFDLVGLRRGGLCSVSVFLETFK